jgi:U3 small nucleolar ribonucleoprotein protein IMP3
VSLARQPRLKIRVASVCRARAAPRARPPPARYRRSPPPLPAAASVRSFLHYKNEGNLRELQAMRRYHITRRDDYKQYNALCGQVTKLVATLRRLDPRDAARLELTDALLDKLHDMGVITTKKSLAQLERLPTSAFCRRRLAVVMVRLRMAEALREAAAFIEQGHVRVGPDTVTDPAFLVTRAMEDFVTWVDTSRIRRKVLAYNDKLDDYDLLN